MAPRAVADRLVSWDRRDFELRAKWAGHAQQGNCSQAAAALSLICFSSDPRWAGLAVLKVRHCMFCMTLCLACSEGCI